MRTLFGLLHLQDQRISDIEAYYIKSGIKALFSPHADYANLCGRWHLIQGNPLCSLARYSTTEKQTNITALINGLCAENVNSPESRNDWNISQLDHDLNHHQNVAPIVQSSNSFSVAHPRHMFTLFKQNNNLTSTFLHASYSDKVG